MTEIWSRGVSRVWLKPSEDVLDSLTTQLRRKTRLMCSMKAEAQAANEGHSVPSTVNHEIRTGVVKQESICNSRGMLHDERFMTIMQEEGLKNVNSANSEEGTWWALFRLLVPRMQARAAPG